MSMEMTTEMMKKLTASLCTSAKA
ncbi:hypothetical protein CAEBREN_17220, partial [Caenorhabditis brenneri]